MYGYIELIAAVFPCILTSPSQGEVGLRSEAEQPG